MREIKFRAWNPLIKRMGKITGFYFMRKESIALWLANGDKGIAECEMDKLEIMQYTGLTDKNGKEIYEGDIVELIRSTPYSYSKGEKFEIVFDNKELCFSAYPIGFAHQKVKKLRVTANKNKIFKNIGNIYENPGLIKAN